MPGGRPTKYNSAMLAKTKAYLDEWVSTGDMIPSVEGLAFYLGITRTTIHDWASQESKKEFSVTLDEIQALQKRTLINKGLNGEFNSNITKLALTNHGMSDKQDVSLGGQRGNPVKWTVEFVDAGVINAKDEG